MEQIKHSELTFQAMVEATPNAIILVNKEGRIAYVNSQSEKLFGYERTELISCGVEILMPKRYHENHPQFRNLFLAAPSTRAMGSGRELFAIRKDQTEFPVEIGLNPLVTVDGTMVLVSIIDITERKKAEERFRLVVESAPYAMILVNKESLISLVNKQTEEVFGYQKNEIIGKPLEILIPERYRGVHPGHRNAFFASPSVRPMGAGRELFGLKKDGTEFPVEIGLNPIDSPEGMVILASVIDITERKKHDAIIKSKIELEAKNKELEQFNYIASHDLKEPLQTVANYIHLIKEYHSEEVSPEVMQHMITIENTAERMNRVVVALLDFSRLGRNRVITACDCNKIVADVVADLNHLIQTSNTKISVGELPVIQSHETELRQLFQNLIHNAIKFRKKDVMSQVEIGCRLENGIHKFFVKDNGIGIEEKYQGRVFQIFQRLNKNSEYEGYGIGLAHCKKIVELHGGKIGIESVFGEGCKIEFTLISSQQ